MTKSKLQIVTKERTPPIIDGRVPPHDLDAEAAVLSAIMLDPTALDAVAPYLRSEHFYSEAHRRIYEAALDLRSRGQPVDVVQIGTCLKANDRIAQIGGMAYLGEILNAAPAVANVRAYADTVRMRARLREMIAVCQRIAAEGYLDVGDPETWLEAAATTTHAIAHDNVGRKTLAHVRDYTKSAIETMQAAAKGGGIAGTPTGFEAIDRLSGGMRGGEVWVVAARPGMGKTALVDAVLRHAARYERIRPSESGDVRELSASLLSSLEMPGEQIALRGACAEARVNVAQARGARLDGAAMGRLFHGAHKVASSRYWIDERPGASLEAVRASAREVARLAERQDARLRVVAIDYLQLMTPGRGNSTRNREQELSEITRGLKTLAKELDVTIVALSQLNRDVEKRANKRPMLSDLRESGAIEQDADAVVFLYREDYYRAPDDPRRGSDHGVTEVIFAKQRNGPVGSVQITFDAPTTRFDDYLEGS